MNAPRYCYLPVEVSTFAGPGDRYTHQRARILSGVFAGRTVWVELGVPPISADVGPTGPPGPDWPQYSTNLVLEGHIVSARWDILELLPTFGRPAQIEFWLWDRRPC